MTDDRHRDRTRAGREHERASEHEHERVPELDPEHERGARSVPATTARASQGADAPAPRDGRRSVPAPGSDPAPETAVPDGERPAARCPHCDRPFTDARLRDLHVGRDHADEADADERAAYEAAREAESEELFVYHLKVIAAIGAFWAVGVLVYMVVLG